MGKETKKAKWTPLNSQKEAAKQHLTGWTFMVYIAGDNNLDPAALKDIAEMAKVGSSEDLNVIVQLDRARDRKTRRFYITRGGGYQKDCVETFDETNTGDPQVLEDFILWGMEKYPASRYALVIWNHGGGWWDEPERARRNIAYDDSSDGDSLNNQELQDVLDKVAQIRSNKIDILGMDACPVEFPGGNPIQQGLPYGHAVAMKIVILRKLC